MPQIDVDFEVFKKLTTLRDTEDVTYNDVVRGLLQIAPRPKTGTASLNGARPWTVSGTVFPVGSDFLAEYRGKSYAGSVKDGKLTLSDGHAFSTPSAAAVHVTRNNVNGWRFWKCRLPGASTYVLIERLRGKAH
jgi:hypothetical protein